jgi:phosphoadenosine phosphosulfate reductase
MTLQEKIAEARELIRAELANGANACVTSSFQTECIALVHMITREQPGIPVLFLETGYHFPETYAYRDDMAARWSLNLVNLAASESVEQQEARLGELYRSAPDQCCKLRKVQPLFGGLSQFDTWFTGLRRDQSPTRANLEPVEPFRLPEGKVLRKISPLALWSTKDVWDYLKQESIPVLPLYDKGYTSVGCWPCTALPADPDNPRSGRWGGNKLECGIHIQA